MPGTSRRAKRFLAGAAAALIAGFSILGASLLSAQGPESKFGAPRPTPVSPIETSAVTPERAKALFRRIPDLDAVVKAAESGDVDVLLGMAKDGDYCEQSFRGEIPDICQNGASVSAVYFFLGDRHLVPVDGAAANQMREILSQQPVKLEFASRDSRYGEGNGGEYYLMFRAARGVTEETDPTLIDQIGIVVKPGEPKPILWFTRSRAAGNGLRWIQEQGDLARYHVLITPESVQGWPGIDDWNGPKPPPPTRMQPLPGPTIPPATR